MNTSTSNRDRPSSLVEKLANYDPNSVGTKANNIFGLPFTCEEAAVVLIPVPWEVTVSYGAGTAGGPAAVLAASGQLDLFDPDGVRIWEAGVALQEIPADWKDRNDQLREKAADYLAVLADGEEDANVNRWTTVIDEINQASMALNTWVETAASHWLSAGKQVGVLGGDHSSPLGLMRALANHYDEYSVLHVDAHADLRIAFEGFEFSHASIMDNALKLPQISRLVQVGIRDLGPAEAERIANCRDRLIPFSDWTLKERLFNGQSWHNICTDIIATLSDRVYVSFDIDGLDPTLCPHTGTPVPGGLGFDEAVYLLRRLANSGKTIIGFDLCEVAPGDTEWDGNVGARMLFRLVSALLKSQMS